MDDKLVQSQNKYLEIKLIEFGILIEIKLQQLQNEPSPIEVTPSGIVNEVNLKQDLKAADEGVRSAVRPEDQPADAAQKR